MMIRNTVLAFTMITVAAACGGGDKETSHSSAPAAAPAKDAAAGSDPVSKAVGKAVEVTGCLDLVGKQNWTAAIDACTKAAGVEPENQQVQAALKSAQNGLAAAKVADAEKAATDAANSAAQDATKGLLNMGK